MLQLLTRDPRQQQILQKIWKQHTTLPPGSLLLATIAGLILNATPSSDPRLRSIRYRKSLKLWADLLPVLSQSDADAMEKSSRLWPVTLRRRYASALLHYKRKCWPSPRSDCRAVRDLRATSVSNSGNLMPHNDSSAHIPGFKCRVALLHRTRKRWPNTLFRWITVCPGFKCSVAIVVRDLSAVK
jgi:hypothetical protein